MGWSLWPWGSSKRATVEELPIDPKLKAHFDEISSESQGKEPIRASIKSTVRSTTGESVIKPLRQVAFDNCAEYQRAYSECLKSGPFSEKVTGCQHREKTLNLCQELQEATLKVLGFDPSKSQSELYEIKCQADELMLQDIKTLKITDEDAAVYRAKLANIQP